MTIVAETQVSRRESSKAARREAILDAAKSLIRKLGSQVSAEKIAQRAAVSTATVYNLIGPREQLLGMLLSDLFDDLRTTVASMKLTDPFLVGDAVVVVSAKMFVADSRLWLHVLPEIRGAFGAQIRTYVSFKPIDLQRQAMRAAKDLGMLSRAADADMTSTQIYAAYNGALFLWSGGFLSDDAFLKHAKAGYWAVLAALASGDHRRRALRELKEIHGSVTPPGLAEIDHLAWGNSTE